MPALGLGESASNQSLCRKYAFYELKRLLQTQDLASVIQRDQPLPFSAVSEKVGLEGKYWPGFYQSDHSQQKFIVETCVSYSYTFVQLRSAF